MTTSPQAKQAISANQPEPAPPPPRLRIGWHAVSAAGLGVLSGDAHPPREPVGTAIPTRPPVPGPPRRPHAPVHRHGTAAALVTLLAAVVVAIVVVATLASSPETGPIAAAEPTADGSQANAADPSYSAPTAPTTAPAPAVSPASGAAPPDPVSPGPASPGPASPARLPTSRTTTIATTTTPATAKPAPAPTEICLPSACATWAGFDANGDILMVCDNLPDGYAGLVLYATSGRTTESRLWASRGSGTCEWRELSLAAGTPITYRVCKGDQSENRIDACGTKVTNTA